MKVVFGLGSNLGSRVALIAYGLDYLETMFGPGVRSKLYRSPAVAAPGATPGPDFINAAIAVETNSSSARIADTIRQLEERAGRRRTTRWANRTLDVDVLWASGPMTGAGLEVPHPRLGVRDFALVPLDDVAPEAGLGGRRDHVRQVRLPRVQRSARRVEVEGALDEADAVACAFAAAATVVGEDVTMLEVEADTASGFISVASGPALVFETGRRWRGVVGREGRGRWSSEFVRGGHAAIGWISGGPAR